MDLIKRRLESFRFRALLCLSLIPLLYILLIRPVRAHFNQQIIAPYLNKQQLENLNNNIEVDLTIGINGLGRFRTNLFKQRGNLVAAIRCLPFEIPDINSLGLPETVLNLTMKKKGLILITGGTGSGSAHENRPPYYALCYIMKT